MIFYWNLTTRITGTKPRVFTGSGAETTRITGTFTGTSWRVLLVRDQAYLLVRNHAYSLVRSDTYLLVVARRPRGSLEPHDTYYWDETTRIYWCETTRIYWYETTRIHWYEATRIYW